MRGLYQVSIEVLTSGPSPLNYYVVASTIKEAIAKVEKHWETYTKEVISVTKMTHQLVGIEDD